VLCRFNFGEIHYLDEGSSISPEGSIRDIAYSCKWIDIRSVDLDEAPLKTLEKEQGKLFWYAGNCD
jgi:hypothetical protein